MRFNSAKIHGLFSNEKDHVGQAIRSVSHTEKLVVSQGFGVQDGGIPLRFLSYIIPPLHLLQQLSATTTILEFYFALEGVLRVNPLDERRTRQNAHMMEEIVRRYILKFHTRDYEKIRILYDQRVEKNSPIDHTLASLTEILKAASIKDNSILRFTEKRGGEKAFRHMTEHASYMRDPLQLDGITTWWLVPTMTSDMTHILMVGGPAEKIFFYARQLLAASVGQHILWRSHQFFTPIGSPPTYHLQQGEPCWEDRLYLPEKVDLLFQLVVRNLGHEPRIIESVLKDLLVLFGDAAGGTDFASLMRYYRDIKRGDSLPKEILHLLQDGWERIRMF